MTAYRYHRSMVAFASDNTGNRSSVKKGKMYYDIICVIRIRIAFRTLKRS